MNETCGAIGYTVVTMVTMLLKVNEKEKQLWLQAKQVIIIEHGDTLYNWLLLYRTRWTLWSCMNN